MENSMKSSLASTLDIAGATQMANRDFMKAGSWLDKMPDASYDKDGEIKYQPTAANMIHYLTHHPKYAGKLRFNEYTSREEYDGAPLEDSNVSEIACDIETDLRIYNKSKLSDVISVVLANNKYNPAQEFIMNLVWDGKERIRTVFHDAFNVEDSELHREMSYKWFMSGIYRLFEPGCNVEGMIVLTSEGGIGKSFFCNALACGLGNCETPLDLKDLPDCVDRMNGSWIVNFDELESLGKTEMSRVKNFLTTRADRVRLKYDRRSKEYKRHCIFIGSTNEETFLRDYTDARERRFWIMKCNLRNGEYHRAKAYMEENDLTQLWAEAYHYYAEFKERGEELCLSLDNSLVNAMTIEQQQFKTSNDDDNIEKFKEILEGEYWTPKDSEYFACEQDFVSQTKAGLQESTAHCHKLNIIPVSWVTTAMGVKYKSQKLKLFADGWEYKTARYAQGIKKCWVRKHKISWDVVPAEDDNSLPF